MSFLYAIFGEHININDLPDGPQKQDGLRIQAAFDSIVDHLRNPATLRHQPINELVTLFWQLVGNRITPACVTPIKTMGFLLAVKNDKLMATVTCPFQWHLRAQEDPYMQMGAMVFCASQARDYWNFLIPASREESITTAKRATMYEAEFLLHLLKTAPDFKPNEYQESVLKRYPHGIAGNPELSYTGLPYMSPRGSDVPFPLRQPWQF